ncbi:hypothetical protein AJ88_24270 [Mesorhizobium amorphae CCBAU 01583]|nr:hypothetical protein AJ88_24270 [Mesorhizobium amorphae CCBAU 01583]
MEPSQEWRTRLRNEAARKSVNWVDVISPEHGELSVFRLSRTTDVALDLHVIGWIGKYHPCDFAIHQGGDDLGIERVATD